MNSLAARELQKRMKLLNDWRFEYIEKNSPHGDTLFDVWKKLHQTKDKLSTCLNSQIKIKNNWLQDITEVSVIH